MLRIVVLMASFAFMASLPSGKPTASDEGSTNQRVCKTPPSNDLTSGNVYSGLRFYYDNKKKDCTSASWFGSPLEDLFKTRFECISNCSRGKGAPFCAHQPIHVCENNGTKSNGTKRNGFTRWFYNITSEKCENYTACSSPTIRDNKNFFITQPYCEMECGGFTNDNVNGMQIDTN